MLCICVSMLIQSWMRWRSHSFVLCSWTKPCMLREGPRILHSSSHGTKAYCLSPTSERGRQITSPHTKDMRDEGNTSSPWFQACLWAASDTREHRGGSAVIKALRSVVLVLFFGDHPYWFILDSWLNKKRPFQLKATQMDPITHYSGCFREYHQWKFL